MQFIETIDRWQGEQASENSKFLANKSVGERPGDLIQTLATERNRRVILRFFKERETIVSAQKLMESQSIMDTFLKSETLVDYIIEKEHGTLLHHFLRSVIIFLKNCLLMNQQDFYFSEKSRALSILKKLENYHLLKDKLEQCQDCFYFKSFLTEILEKSPWDQLTPEKYAVHQETITAFIQNMQSLSPSNLLLEFEKIFKLVMKVWSTSSKKKLFLENFAAIYPMIIKLVKEEGQVKVTRSYIRFISYSVSVSSVFVEVKKRFELESSDVVATQEETKSDRKSLYLQHYKYLIPNESIKYVETATQFLLDIDLKNFPKVRTGKTLLLFVMCFSKIVQAHFSNIEFQKRFEGPMIDRLISLLGLLDQITIMIPKLEMLYRLILVYETSAQDPKNKEKAQMFWNQIRKKYEIQAKMAEKFALGPIAPLRIDCQLFPIVNHQVLAGEFDKRLFYFSPEQTAESNFIIRFKVRIEEKNIKVGIFIIKENFRISEKNLLKSKDKEKVLGMTLVGSEKSLSGVLSISKPCLVYFVFDNSYSILNEKRFQSCIHVLRSTP